MRNLFAKANIQNPSVKLEDVQYQELSVNGNQLLSEVITKKFDWKTVPQPFLEQNLNEASSLKDIDYKTIKLGQ